MAGKCAPAANRTRSSKSLKIIIFSIIFGIIFGKVFGTILEAILDQFQEVFQDDFWSYFCIDFLMCFLSIWGGFGRSFGQLFWKENRYENLLIFGRFLKRIQERFQLPKWYKNQSNRVPGRTLKTLISHGRYCKNQGMGPSRSLQNAFKKLLENMYDFHSVLNIFLGRLLQPKVIEKAIKQRSKYH